KTAEKLRYLRLSSSIRKNRSKRNSQPSSAHFLQSPVITNGRNSTSSVSNTTGCYLMPTTDHDDEDFEEEPMKLWS
ncbi:unnamed protein product, partial [Rotaria sordida]